MKTVVTPRRRLRVEWLPIYTMWLRQIIRFFMMRARVISTFVQSFIFLSFLILPMSRLFGKAPPEFQRAVFGGLTFWSIGAYTFSKMELMKMKNNKEYISKRNRVR